MHGANRFNEIQAGTNPIERDSRRNLGTDGDREGGRFAVTDSEEEETKQRHLTAALRGGVVGVGLLALAAVLFRVLRSLLATPTDTSPSYRINRIHA